LNTNRPPLDKPHNLHILQEYFSYANSKVEVALFFNYNSYKSHSPISHNTPKVISKCSTYSE